MDQEGARLLTYSSLMPTVRHVRLPPVYKYSSLRSTAQRAVGPHSPLRWSLGYTHCAGSEGSMSSFKSIT